jgi:hypothetical protein
MNRKRQHGATLVEAALTMLVFFTFLFGILEFGRAYNIYQAVTSAAREGARFAVAPCAYLPTTPACPYGAGVLPTKTDITTQVTNYLQAANIPAVSATVNICQGPTDTSCPASTTMPNPCITVNGINTCYTVVDVAAPYRFLFFKFGTISIRSESSMRNETN